MMKLQAISMGGLAPTFVLPDPKGQLHDFAELSAGQPALVLFLANHCPYVKHVAPVLGELTARWIAEGLAVVAVNSNAETHPGDAPDRMVPFAQAHGWTFPYLVDADQQIARDYGAVCTPDVFLFDQQHCLAYRGQIDDSRPGSDVAVTGKDLEAAVRAVLAHHSVPQNQRPSVGCSIKWKSGSGNPPPN